MSKKKGDLLVTQESFKNVCSRHDFTQAEKGTRAYLDECLKEVTTKVTVLAMIQADHDKHKGLNRKDAKSAVKMTKEIPNGNY